MAPAQRWENLLATRGTLARAMNKLKLGDGRDGDRNGNGLSPWYQATGKVEK